MRIVFRSEDRYRGHSYASGGMADLPGRAGQEQEKGPPAAGRRSFEMRERLDFDGMRRLILRGDLDLPVAASLSARLGELQATGDPVRLDLSELAFIDSSGLQALIVALIDARSIGWQLEVASEVSASVERAAQLVGIAQVLWPEPRPDRRSDAARAAMPPP